VLTTSGTYPWSFVIQIFHNGQTSHDGDSNIFEVMTSTLPKGTLGSVASLLLYILSEKNHDKGETPNTSKNYFKYCIFYQNLGSPPSGIRDHK
jgi:hypothetical protein